MSKLDEKCAELETLKAEQTETMRKRDELEESLLTLVEKIAAVEAEVAELEAAAATEAGAADAPESAPSGRPCPKCTTMILAGHKFCMGCGTPVASLVFPEVHVCPGCGTKVDKGYKFCPECGKLLS